MFRNLEAEQARFGYTNQQMADKSMMFATDNEPREKGGDNDRNDGYVLKHITVKTGCSVTHQTEPRPALLCTQW